MPKDVFTWCNNDLPSQRFERLGTMDWLYQGRVTYGGVNYCVNIRIYGVWHPNGTRVSDCNSTSATPAALYNTWTCVWNVGDPWYQNWDACPGHRIKMMLYCWPVAGCIDVQSADGARSAHVAEFLDLYLDTEANMLSPAGGPPALNPAPAPRHVYAMRPVEVGRTCPDYTQPRGCP